MTTPRIVRTRKVPRISAERPLKAKEQNRTARLVLGEPLAPALGRRKNRHTSRS